jgi:hypothetical protein
MATPDQISFYDETLKKQIEGSYRYYGKRIHICSVVYGAESASPNGRIDHFALALFAQEVLRDLARDAEADKSIAKPLKMAA